jgi:hypothetical protein
MHDVQQSLGFTAPSFTPAGTQPVTDTNGDRLTPLAAKLRTESLKNQLPLVAELAEAGDDGWEHLMNFLAERKAAGQSATPIDGKIYQHLLRAAVPKTHEFLKTEFPNGLVQLRSEKGIDYSALQDLLVEQSYEAADRLTLEKFCELAGALAIKRKWVYFTEVEQFPIADLQTINDLWLVYSEGKFGFSVQRELWLSLGKNWEKLWEKIAWKAGNNWTRYPGEFTWDLSAPRGHLPLSNQLRGVRVIAALMAHPAWIKD